MMTVTCALAHALLSYGQPLAHSKLTVDGVCIASTYDSLKQSLAPGQAGYLLWSEIIYGWFMGLQGV